MSRDPDFANGQVLNAAALDVILEVLSGITINCELEQQSSTAVRVVAGADGLQSSINLQGKMRWVTSTQSVTISGGSGTYFIYAAADVDSPAGETNDPVTRGFHLESFISGGSTPTTAYRKIGEVDWSGTAITAVRSLVAAPSTDSPTFTGPVTLDTPDSSSDTNEAVTSEWVRDLLTAGVSQDVQIFTGNGTWDKPAGAKSVYIRAIGGGGGGGSGRSGAAGQASGGAGGGSGGVSEADMPASGLPSSVPVVIGTGGAGGTAVGPGVANGNTGSAGNNTTFLTGTASGSVIALGGAGGSGGVNGTASGGLGGNKANFSNNPGNGATGVVGAGSNSLDSWAGPSGGAGGGGFDTVNPLGGQLGGDSGIAELTRSRTDGSTSGAGIASTVNAGGSGGAGGNATDESTGSGSPGGVGGVYGGGGGGGGAKPNGASGTSGAGGTGGAGICVVITTF